MKKIYLVLLIGLLSTTAHAQGVNFEWAKSIGGTTDDGGYSITTDASGNVYVTGYFEGTVDFDPSVADTFNLTSNGLDDVFIQKLDGNGNFIWAKSMGGTSVDVANSITTDASGNVYVTGYYDGTVDFDPSTSTFNLISHGNADVFIQKLDGSGNFIWAKSIGGTSTDYGHSISTDASGNVYITGYYRKTADFDPGAATFDLTTNGSDDIFVLKLDGSGNFIWAKSMGGISWDDGYSITTDASGNVYVTGYYVDTVDFDPGAAIFNLNSNGSYDVFILKLDGSGNFIWAKSVGGTGYDAGYSITTDTSGNVYVTGGYRDTVDFDPSAAIFNLTSNGKDDVFIQKLDVNGNFIWAKSMGGSWKDHGHSITTDAYGNVYVTGYYWTTVDFDPSAATFNLTSKGNADVFIQKLDGSGNFIWAKSMGGIGVGFTDDYGQSITIDTSGNVYVTGMFHGLADFDPSTDIFNLTSNGKFDVFIQKLSQSAVGIEENSFFNGVSIFPNPNQGLVTIDLANLKEVSIKVFSVSGQLIYHKENINTSIHQFELKQATGVYFIEVSSQGEKQQYKLVKN